MTREPWLLTLERLVDGQITVPEARLALRGADVPVHAGMLIKAGRWASEGGYETGARGARAAAEDALREWHANRGDAW